MTLLQDIISYLTGLGVVEGPGIDSFIDFKPEAPDSIVSFHEYQGEPISPYTNVAHRSVQIVVRDRSAVNAKSKVFAIFEALKPETEGMRVDFTESRWGQVYLRHTPHKFSQDESDRVHYGFNLGITTEIKKEAN